MRPADLAREHGLSTQAVRNYERDGFLPPADRTPSGYRVYTAVHAAALRAFLALVGAYGHGAAGRIMNAVHAGALDDVLTTIDSGHVQLLRDRETLDTVRRTVHQLTAPPTPDPSGAVGGDVTARRVGVSGRGPVPQPPGPPTPTSGPAPRTIGELAHHLRLTPATLRTWERAGILAPARDPATRYRVFGAADVRDAELAHLLRRGGYPLEHIATVVGQVRTAGGTEALAGALDAWQDRLTAQGLAMLGAAGRLGEYLTSAPVASRR